MPQVTLRSVDGGRVVVTSPSPLDATESTSVAVFENASNLHEFHAGDQGLGSYEAAEEQITFTEQYSFQGGTLYIGSVVDVESGESYTLTLGSWVNGNYSAFAYIGDGSSSEVIALFNLFSLSIEPYGIVMKPQDPATKLVRDSAQAPRVMNPVPNIGLLDIVELTADTAVLIPPWPGAPVEGGELFVNGAGTYEVTMVLVSSTVIAYLLPDHAVTEAAMTDFMSDVKIDWFVS